LGVSLRETPANATAFEDVSTLRHASKNGRGHVPRPFLPGTPDVTVVDAFKKRFEVRLRQHLQWIGFELPAEFTGGSEDMKYAGPPFGGPAVATPTLPALREELREASCRDRIVASGASPAAPGESLEIHPPFGEQQGTRVLDA